MNTANLKDKALDGLMDATLHLEAIASALANPPSDADLRKWIEHMAEFAATAAASAKIYA